MGGIYTGGTVRTGLGAAVYLSQGEAKACILFDFDILFFHLCFPSSSSLFQSWKIGRSGCSETERGSETLLHGQAGRKGSWGVNRKQKATTFLIRAKMCVWKSECAPGWLYVVSVFACVCENKIVCVRGCQCEQWCGVMEGWVWVRAGEGVSADFISTGQQQLSASVHGQDGQTCVGCGRWVNMVSSFKSFLFLRSRPPLLPVLRSKTLFQIAPIVTRPACPGPRGTCQTLTLYLFCQSVGPRTQVFVLETLGSSALSAVPSP